MTEDFSSHPPTIGDIRSDKTQNAKDWSVRDALIKTLREIDSGKMVAHKIVMVIEVDKEKTIEGEYPRQTTVRQAGTLNVYDTFGMLSWAQHVLAMD